MRLVRIRGGGATEALWNRRVQNRGLVLRVASAAGEQQRHHVVSAHASMSAALRLCRMA